MSSHKNKAVTICSIHSHKPSKYFAPLTIKTVRCNADFSSARLNAIQFPDIHRTDKSTVKVQCPNTAITEQSIKNNTQT